MKVILRAVFALALVCGINIAHAQEVSTHEPSFVDKFTSAVLEKEVMCLARNIYYEAGAESFEGKVAVAQVSINRAESGKFPETLCGVVNQRTTITQKVTVAEKTTLVHKVVCQFSWVCEGKRLRVAFGDRWEEAIRVARMVLVDGYRNPKFEDAMYFHAVHVNPGWGLPKVARVGNHVFYRDRTPKVQQF